MTNLNLLLALAFAHFTYMVSAGLLLPRQDTVVQQPNSSSGPPPGFSVGFSTVSGSKPFHPGFTAGPVLMKMLLQQDHEPAGQQSGCSTSCPSSSYIHSNDQMGPNGAYAAAVNPQMFGSDSICGACGKCFNVINAGVAAPDGPGGPSPQVAANQQISIWVVNSCTDCKMVSSKKLNVQYPQSLWITFTLCFLAHMCDSGPIRYQQSSEWVGQSEDLLRPLLGQLQTEVGHDPGVIVRLMFILCMLSQTWK